MGLWLLSSGGEDEAAFSFDGTTAVYAGPERVAAGEEITLVLQNASTRNVAFAAALVKTDWTLDMAREYESPTFRRSAPPWMASYRVIANLGPGQTLDQPYTFHEYAYELYVWDWDYSLGYHAGWIEATK